MKGTGIRFFQSIQAKLIIIYVLLILIAMQLIGVYFYRTLESYFKSDFLNSRETEATLLTSFVEDHLLGIANQEGKNQEEKNTYTDLNNIVSNLFAISNAEIQIIDANGMIIITSDPNHQAIVGQKNPQTEVTRALEGISNQRMFTDTDNYRKIAIAKPIGSGRLGAVYIVVSMEELYNTISSINQILISGTLIATGLTAVLGVMLSSTITSPIKEITKQVTAVAEGNFDEQVKVHGKDEIGQLGNTFNFMINRLKDAVSLNEEEKEKLASILTNMNDGVIATDNQGKVIILNRRAKQILQLSDEEALGKNISLLLDIPQEIIDDNTAGENRATLLDIEHPDEEEQLSVRVTFTPIHRRVGGVTGTIAVLQDVTEQEKLEQARREFVANVSHELRTPLTTIKSYLEALDDGALEEPQLAQRFIGVTRSETERMIRLVTDLLHLSRLDSKQAMMSKETTRVSEMLEEVADRFSFQLRQRNIRIEIRVESGMPSILLDRDKIDQVLDNLVSNAIKYTGDEGTIRIIARRIDKGQIEISVQDTGIGIPKKDLARIFERFYRVDKARSRNMGGTGLGLSIAREIVKAHGGTIALESELGQGTKVTFTLPMQVEGIEAI
jgi:two-component system sensor histidine kinase VicK